MQLTVEQARGIIDPKRFSNSTNVLVHKDTLDALYQVLRFLGTTFLVSDEGMASCSTVALRISGKRKIYELCGSSEALLEEQRHSKRALSPTTALFEQRNPV